MREYDKTTLKIAERVFEKGDEILAMRKKRAAKIRLATYTASGLCAAVIVCFGVWHFSSSSKKPYENDNIITSTQTTTQACETTSAVTTTSDVGEATATASETTVTAVNTTTAAKSITTAVNAATTIRRTTTAFKTTPARTTVTIKTTSHKTTAPLTTSTSVRTVADDPHDETGHPEPPPSKTTTSFPRITDSPVVTATSANQSDGEEKYTTYPQTTAAVADTTTGKEIASPITEETVIHEMREIFLAYPATVEVKNDTLCLYNKQNKLISPDKIDKKNIYLSQVKIKISDKESLNLGMEMYNIIGTSREEAVAVRFLQTDEYYLFTNPDIKS
jgi:hypothetical protein